MHSPHLFLPPAARRPALGLLEGDLDASVGERLDGAVDIPIDHHPDGRVGDRRGPGPVAVLQHIDALFEHDPQAFHVGRVSLDGNARVT